MTSAGIEFVDGVCSKKYFHSFIKKRTSYIFSRNN